MERGWRIGKAMLHVSLMRFCMGIAVDPEYVGIYLGPVTFLIFRVLTVTVSG